MDSRKEETPISEWTTNDIPDLTGKVAVVTGANSGLGLEITHQLAKKGCEVIMACRNMSKAEHAMQEVLSKVPDAKLSVEKLDLSDLESIKDFTDGIIDKYKSLSLLINNAGVMDLPHTDTTDSIDTTFQTNYLAPFLLTSQLYPLLKNDKTARIVQVGSTHHEYGKIDFDDLQCDKLEDRGRAPYYNSKLMLLNFTIELNRRIQGKEHSVLSVAAHPGFSATNILTSTTGKNTGFLMNTIFNVINYALAQPAEKGALPILYAATAKDVEGGKYYGPDGWNEWSGNIKEARGIDPVYDTEVAKKLWYESESLLQNMFNFDVSNNNNNESRVTRRM